MAKESRRSPTGEILVTPGTSPVGERRHLPPNSAGIRHLEVGNRHSNANRIQPELPPLPGRDSLEIERTEMRTVQGHYLGAECGKHPANLMITPFCEDYLCLAWPEQTQRRGCRSVPLAKSGMRSGESSALTVARYVFGTLCFGEVSRCTSGD